MDRDQMDNFQRFQKLFDQVGLPLLRAMFVCRFIHSNDSVKGSEEWKSNRDFGSRLLEMIKNQTLNHNHGNHDIDNYNKDNKETINVNVKGTENDLYLSEAQKRLISTGFLHKFDFHLLCILLTKIEFHNNNNDRLPKQDQMEQMQKWCMENRKIEQLASIFQHLTEVYGSTEKIPTTLFCPMWSITRSAMAHLGANTKEMNDIWAMSFKKPITIPNGSKKSVIPSYVSDDGCRVRSNSFGASSGPNPYPNPNWPRKSVIPSHVTETGHRARSNSIGSAQASSLSSSSGQHWPRKSAIPPHVSQEGGGGGRRIRSNSFGSSSVPPPHSRSRRASTCSTDYYYISPTNNLSTVKSISSSPIDGKSTAVQTDTNLLLSTAFSKLNPNTNKEQNIRESPNNFNEHSPLISSSSPTSSNLPHDNADRADHKFSMEKIFTSCSVPVLLHGISLVIIASVFWIYNSHLNGANMYISILGICLGIFRIIYCIPCIIMRRKNSKNRLIYIGLAHLGTGILLCLTLVVFLLLDFSKNSGFHGESNNALSVAFLIILGIEPCISFFCLGFGLCYMKHDFTTDDTCDIMTT